MRNYLGLSSEKDKGYAYVIVLCASIWSGLSLGLRLRKVPDVDIGCTNKHMIYMVELQTLNSNKPL